jgi:hypothetical protein
MSHSILFYHNSELKFVFDKKEKTKSNILEYLVKKANPNLNIEQFQLRYINNITQLYKEKKTTIGENFYKIDIINNNILIKKEKYKTKYMKLKLVETERKEKLSLIDI